MMSHDSHFADAFYPVVTLVRCSMGREFTKLSEKHAPGVLPQSGRGKSASGKRHHTPKNAGEIFRRYLKANGQKYSQARAIILSRVVEARSHFSAEELATKLATGHDRVSRGTVYRTLHLLENASVVRKIHGRARHRYEYTPHSKQQDHMVCDICGQVFKWPSANLDKRLRILTGKEGFMMRAYQIQVFGVCSHCQRGSKEGPAPSE